MKASSEGPSKERRPSSESEGIREGGSQSWPGTHQGASGSFLLFQVKLAEKLQPRFFRTAIS